MKGNEIQAVIDIGSSQIRVSVAQMRPHHEIEIIGCGVVNSHSVKNGVITDISATVQALHSAIEEAERQSNVEIRNVDVSVGGQTIKALNTNAQITIHDEKVHKEDVKHVVCAARDKGLSDGMSLLHALDQQFIIDEHSGIAQPLGMMADHLTACLHVVSVRQNIEKNIRRSIEAAGIGINAMVFSGLASSYEATTEEERESGVCVIDIGAGTTNFMMWSHHTPIYSGGIDLGGEFISSELAQNLATTRQYAEMLKCQYGSVTQNMLKAKNIEIPSTGFRTARPLEGSELVENLAVSYQRIFTAFSQSLYDQGMRKTAVCSVLLTGGASQISGLSSYVSDIFNLPVRVVKPKHIEGLPDYLQYDPGMMTTFGMLRLLYQPISDRIWEMPTKIGIITRLSNFLNRS